MTPDPMAHPRPRGSNPYLAPFQLLLALFLLPPVGAGAQEPVAEIRLAQGDEVQELVLRDGSVIFGQVTALGDPFTFRLLSGGEMSVSLSQLRSLLSAPGEVIGEEFWREDPNQTRLFFGPTARPLKKGTGYLAVYEIVMPFLGVGITDNFILAGGTPLFFGWGGSRPFWLAPKYTFFNSETTQAAAGVLAFVVDDHSAGILYGVLTKGGTKASATVGLGFGYVDDELAEKPAIMFGGGIRTSRRIKLVSENYLFPSGDGLLSIGPRFIGDRLSADLGLVAPLGLDEFFVFLLINFVWNF
jgi:hypothetical protein